MSDLKELARSESLIAAGSVIIEGHKSKESDLYNAIYDMYTQVRDHGPHATEAKAALEALAPKSCKGNCNAFMGMIVQASDEMDREDMGAYYDDYKALKNCVKKGWDKPELMAFAKNPKTAPAFKRLLGIADAVWDPKGDVEKAGNALDGLLPEGFDRQKFTQLIETVATETRAEHPPRRLGVLGHSLNGMDAGQQQEMLATLDAKLHPSVTGEPKLIVSDEHIQAGIAKLKPVNKDQQKTLAA